MAKDTPMTIEEFMTVRTEVVKVISAASTTKKDIEIAEQLISKGYVDIPAVLAEVERRNTPKPPTAPSGVSRSTTPTAMKVDPR